MKNNFYNKEPYISIYEQPSYKSKISSQILYGEKFKILSEKKSWLKIKTFFDNYIGYIKKKNYSEKFSPTHKISILKADIFKFSKKYTKCKLKKFLPFGSKIEILEKYRNFVMFEKNKWINLKDTKKKSFKEKNYIKILKMFINCRYKWGGKTYDGIDCSALLQLFFQFNNQYVPRDTKDQIKFFNKKRKFLMKNNIIFWKGHVAVCINRNSLIHAYGPRKKVLIMNIKKTINEIKKNAKLEVIKKINKNERKRTRK